MGDYKYLTNKLIEEFEGFSPNVYNDSEGNPTIGHGINLNDIANKSLLELSGKNVQSLIEGKESLSEDESKFHKENILQRKEREIKNQLGADIFDNLRDNEKAAIMSLGYNNINLLGPKLKNYLADPNKKIETTKEIILNSNQKQDPGLQLRRLKEAELFADPIQFANSFKDMSDEEKSKILNNLNKLKNPNQKQMVIEKYNPFLTKEESKPQFLKLKQLLKP